MHYIQYSMPTTNPAVKLSRTALVIAFHAAVGKDVFVQVGHNSTVQLPFTYDDFAAILDYAQKQGVVANFRDENLTVIAEALKKQREADEKEQARAKAMQGFSGRPGPSLKEQGLYFG